MKRTLLSLSFIFLVSLFTACRDPFLKPPLPAPPLPTATPTPTPTVTCHVPIAIPTLGSGILLPFSYNYASDLYQAKGITLPDPVVLHDTGECETYFEGMTLCSGTDFSTTTLIVWHSQFGCGGASAITLIEQNCDPGLTLFKTYQEGCQLCQCITDSYSWLSIPATDLNITRQFTNGSWTYPFPTFVPTFTFPGWTPVVPSPTPTP